MAVLPVDKLLGLLVRQLSKPLANQIKQQAVGHPLLRRAFIGFGQIWHRWEMNIKIRFLGHIPIAIKALPEEKAFQSGAEVFGELFVYCTAAGVLLNEYNRSAKKEVEKTRKLNAAFDAIAERVEELQYRVDVLEWELRRMHEKGEGDRPEESSISLPRLSLPKPSGIVSSLWGAVTSPFSSGGSTTAAESSSEGQAASQPPTENATTAQTPQPTGPAPAQPPTTTTATTAPPTQPSETKNTSSNTATEKPTGTEEEPALVRSELLVR
eukprot:comp23692_c0_seq1/m.40678 comp23692_c0_seq1/g.40678  ORF comp23692_c0_seq1/g.40678 comp23692_c0_seq1/m.40678 type:complete len:268 (-) comp23692_c0_seq1:394-1197(-)